MFGDENASSDNLLNSFSVEHVALKKKKEETKHMQYVCGKETTVCTKHPLRG